MPREVTESHTATSALDDDVFTMNAIAGLAILLLICWVVLRVALAVTSGLLHLLWIAALIMLAMWVIGKLRGSKNT